MVIFHSYVSFPEGIPRLDDVILNALSKCTASPGDRPAPETGWWTDSLAEQRLNESV